MKERRNQLVRPQYVKPELLAQAPNEVWSWDITKLKGPVKWTYYYLYVILDIFKHGYVVGWMVAQRELAILARKLIGKNHEKAIDPAGTAFDPCRQRFEYDLKIGCLPHGRSGCSKSHSRPSVSNDNPYSESQFRTMKYRPEFPERFGSIEHARAFSQTFFPWYNKEHYHSGLGLMTPEDVHYGRAPHIIKARRRCSLVPTNGIRNASRGGYRNLILFLLKSGSINHHRCVMEGYTKCLRKVSHFH